MPSLTTVPADVLPRARQLPGAHELARLLAAPPAQGRLVLLEAGCESPAGFLEAHIPGAAWLDIATLETPPLYNKIGDADLLALLLARGITHDCTVILYGRRHCLAAARAAHLLMYAGVTDVRLLDGGLRAWQGAGLACASGPGPEAVSASAFGAPFPGRPDLLADTDHVVDCVRSGGATLASIRTRAEFNGATSGYAYISARGEIPGARWGRAGCDGDVHSMSAYQLPDGRMRPARHIAAMWQESGICADTPVVFYCGTGWRASLAFFHAHVMGWDRISVYDGGWFEYSQLHPALRTAALR